MYKITTAQGETWDGVAYREFGSVKYTGELMKANSHLLHDYYIFAEGLELVIPDVEVDLVDDALPWKKAAVG